MKHLAIAVALCAVLLTMSAVFANPADCGTWTPQPAGSTGFFSGVSCVNAADAWACGQDGTIVRTTDGGLTWKKLATDVPSDEEITAVEFTSVTHGWATGVANAMLRTTNGGTTWSSQSWLGSIYPPKLLAVSAVDASHVWIGAYETSNWMNWNTYRSVLLGTSDGKTWWSPSGVVVGDYGHGITGLDFVDVSHGWAVADNAVTSSSDGGRTWAPLRFIDEASSFRDVSFADGQYGWVVGEDSSYEGFIMRTSDGGQNWDRQAEDEIAAGAISGVNAVCAVSPSTAWAVCEGGSVLHTTNAGATWVLERPTTQDLNDVSFITAETGWAVGDAGVVLRHGPAPEIDDKPPTSVAIKNMSVVRGGKVALPFKVSDPLPSCGKAKVTITIKRVSKIVKTISLTGVPTNKVSSYSFRVTLAKGGYTWTVKATDIAGNAGKVSAARKLTVR